MLDAKSSLQELGAHERQIRAYIDQRHLDYGVLFNLRELRVCRRGVDGHDAALSFDAWRLWQVAHGEALDIDEVERFARFCAFFAIGHLVRAVAANRTALLALRPIAPELRRAVENTWRTHGVEVDRARVLAEMPARSRAWRDLYDRRRARTSGFAAEVARRQDEIDALLDVGRRLVEAVQRLVCALYGVPDALTELVVASAVTRSGTVAAEAD